jgi:hypothetical protein
MKRIWIALAALVVVSVVSALTAANIVPSTKASRSTSTIDANALKPDECAALNLTAVVNGDTGTSANELILGTSGANSPTGSGGDDCIVAGAGNDTIDGGTGTDVCLGGAGTDTYANCETQTDPDGACSSPGTQTLSATADSFVEEDKPNDNSGGETRIRTKADATKKRRGLISFTLPALPSGCTATATLRLNATNVPAGGHTINVYRASASWGESTVTWNNQPGTTGTAVGATAVLEWVEWNVDAHVQAMYAGTNNGFKLLDSTDGGTPVNGETQFRSKEDGTTAERPELVLTFS